VVRDSAAGRQSYPVRSVVPELGQCPDTSISRTLPIFSVDSGMTFERPSNWFGRDYTQTLEPRLFYLNIPYKNQNQIPIFDTGLADFNLRRSLPTTSFPAGIASTMPTS
jgi:LPS-assembly protein